MSHLRAREAGERGDSVAKPLYATILWKFERERERENKGSAT